MARGRFRARPRGAVRPEPPRPPFRHGHVRLPGRQRSRVRGWRQVEARGGLLGGEGARGGDARVRGSVPAPRSGPSEEAHAARLGERAGVDEGRSFVVRAAARAIERRGDARQRVQAIKTLAKRRGNMLGALPPQSRGEPLTQGGSDMMQRSHLAAVVFAVSVLVGAEAPANTITQNVSWTIDRAGPPRSTG